MTNKYSRRKIGWDHWDLHLHGVVRHYLLRVDREERNSAGDSQSNVYLWDGGWQHLATFQNDPVWKVIAALVRVL